MTALVVLLILGIWFVVAACLVVAASALSSRMSAQEDWPAEEYPQVESKAGETLPAADLSLAHRPAK